MDALKVYCNKHLHLWCDEMHDLSSLQGHLAECSVVACGVRRWPSRQSEVRSG